MKNIFTSIVALLFTLILNAQAPQKMSYQAVVRDMDDNLVTSSTIGMRISILEDSDTGTAVYTETHSPLSNANGLVSIEVGAGSVVSGDFSTIDWGNHNYYLKSEVDPSGGTTYSISGVSQLLSVPYALYSGGSASGHNNLDEAYDEDQGMFPGARIIDVDDGQIKLVADGNVGLEIESDNDEPGLLVVGYGDGGAIDVGNVLNSDSGDAVDISNDGGGDAIDIDNDGGGEAIDINNVGDGDAILVASSGNGQGLKIDMTNALGAANAVEVNHVGLGDALSITNDAIGTGLFIDQTNPVASDVVSIANAGLGVGIDLTQTNAANASEVVLIDNDGTGDGIHIIHDQEGAGKGIYLEQDGLNHALDIDNSGSASAINITQSDALNASDAAIVVNDGLGASLSAWNTNVANPMEVAYLKQDGTGNAMTIENFNAGLGHGLFVDQSGDGNAIDVANLGDGHGLLIGHGNPLNVKDAAVILNGGDGKGLYIAQMNAGTLSAGMTLENAGTGVGAEFINSDMLNPSPVMHNSQMGLGPVALLEVADNDLNIEPALVSKTMGSGSAGQFIIEDNIAGKTNFEPALNVVSNGLGAGVNISIMNPFMGADANFEPALFAGHEGYGQTGTF